MHIGIGLWAGVAMLLGTISQGEDRKPPQKPFDDAEFVKMAASSGMAEVMIGKVGAEKAGNAGVKKLAETVVTDHTKANDELKAAAKEAGVLVPEKISDEHQKLVDSFKNYKGDNFDRDFIRHMVKSHEASVDLYTKASKEAKNRSLRDFATKTLPTIQAHLETAKKLSRE